MPLDLGLTFGTSWTPGAGLHPRGAVSGAGAIAASRRAAAAGAISGAGGLASARRAQPVGSIAGLGEVLAHRGGPPAGAVTGSGAIAAFIKTAPRGGLAASAGIQGRRLARPSGLTSGLVDITAAATVTGGAGAPAWVRSGASLDLDFAGARAWVVDDWSTDLVNGTEETGIADWSTWLATVRASAKTAEADNGDLAGFASGEPAITDRGLLAEGATVQSVRSSVDLTNATYWSLSSGVARAYHSSLGDLDLYEITEGSSSGYQRIYTASANRPTFSSGNHTASVYFLKGYGKLELGVVYSSNDVTVLVDTATPSIVDTLEHDGGGTSFDYVSSRIVQVAGDLYRLELVFNFDSSSILILQCGVGDDDTLPATHQGNGTRSVVVGGMQLEEDTMGMTSLVVTGASTLARAADDIEIAPTLGQWLNEADTTALIDFVRPSGSVGTLLHFEGTKEAYAALGGADDCAIDINSGAVSDASVGAAQSAGDAVQAALRVKANDHAWKATGGAEETDAANGDALDTITAVHVGSLAGASAFLGGTITRITVFPANSDLDALIS